MVKNVEKIDKDIVKTIKDSSKKFGQLYPVLLDANDEIIDGEHRKQAIKNVSVVKLDSIKTKKDRLEARLVANHARKGQDASTWIPTLTELAKILAREGIEKIGLEIAEQTGLPYRTLMRYLPDEFKDLAQSQRASKPRLPSGIQKEGEFETPSSSEVITTKVESLPQDKNRPKIAVREFKNQPWNAIIVPKDFYGKLKETCDKKGVNLEEEVTLALMRLLEELRRK